MLIIERVVALGAASVFSELPDHILARVASVVEEVTAEVGDVIIHEGRTESWMFILVTGKATATVSGTKVAELISGEVIGELAALDPEPRSATVTAIEPCLLFKIDHVALQEVIFDQPDIAMAIITMLAKRLRETNRELERLANRAEPDAGVG